VLFWCRFGVVVEVVHDQGMAVRWDIDVEFKEKRDDTTWSGIVGGESEEDISIPVNEIEEDVWSQCRAICL